MKTKEQAIAKALAEIHETKARIARLIAGTESPEFNEQKERLIAAFREIEGCRFVGITYTSKGTGESARYTIRIGDNYISLLEKSLLELDLTKEQHIAQPIGEQAFAAVRASLVESIEKHKIGEQNSAYTKAGMYVFLCSGLKLSLNDGSLEVCGVQHAKKVLTPGVYKTVKSSPLTLAKDAIRSTLPVSKYRTLALDPGAIQGARIEGDSLEFD